MDSSQDRQLPATAHKLEQARQDGQAPRSRDLSHLAVLGTGSVAVLALLPPVAVVVSMQRWFVRGLTDGEK